MEVERLEGSNRRLSPSCDNLGDTTSSTRASFEIGGLATLPSLRLKGAQVGGKDPVPVLIGYRFT
jgi:hypothetical protein